MLKKNNILKSNVGQLAVLSVCFIAGMFLFSMSTSPLTANMLGLDSSIFSLLGKGIASGKTLYVDLFDHKGPLIFFVNALGHMLGGRTGIFFIQCLNGLVCLFLLYNTVRILKPEEDYLSLKDLLFIFVPSYTYFFYTFERGNLTEEYSLLFICISLFLFCKYAANEKDTSAHNPVYAAVYGVSFAALALFRLNNAVTVCAGIFVIFCNLIYKKQFKNLFLNLAAGTAGMAVVIVPTLLYFNSKSALNDMIYATFLHNFQIAANTGHESVLSKPQIFLILYAPIGVSAFLWIANALKEKKLSFFDCLAGTILILNLASLWIANRFPHYFAVFVPVYSVCIAKYLPTVSFKKLSTFVLVCSFALSAVGLGYYDYYKNFNSYFITKETTARSEAIKKALEIIPENEKDSVIGYQIRTDVYHYADIIPCYKYYTLQETWAITNPQITDDFFAWIETEKPLWVIKDTESSNEIFENILEEHYEEKIRNEYIVIYKLKTKYNECFVNTHTINKKP
ncbi:MAG: hypothetical protein J6J45_08435 [Clostridia bacterium]|nr:hypothetical protein [Clostridia bacterium]